MTFFTAGDDHLVGPALNVEEAVLVDPADITSVKPAVGVEGAGRNGRALNRDLATLDPQVRSEQGAADRTDLAPRFGHFEGSHREQVSVSP